MAGEQLVAGPRRPRLGDPDEVGVERRLPSTASRGPIVSCTRSCSSARSSECDRRRTRRASVRDLRDSTALAEDLVDPLTDVLGCSTRSRASPLRSSIRAGTGPAWPGPTAAGRNLRPVSSSDGLYHQLRAAMRKRIWRSRRARSSVSMSLRCRSVAVGDFSKTSWLAAHSLSTRWTNSACADDAGYSCRVMIILANPSSDRTEAQAEVRRVRVAGIGIGRGGQLLAPRPAPRSAAATVVVAPPCSPTNVVTRSRTGSKLVSMTSRIRATLALCTPRSVRSRTIGSCRGIPA